MNISELDELLKQGILTEEEYNEFFESMRVDEKGEMTGILPPLYRSCIRKYDFEGNLLDGELLDFVVNDLVVPLGAEDLDKTFKKYGFTYCGICDGWRWFKENTITEKQIQNGFRPIEDASESELWKMIAICSRYWWISYKRLYDKYKKLYYENIDR